MPDGMNLPVLDVVPANDRQNTSTSSVDLPVLDVVPAGTAQAPAQPAPDDLPVLDVVPAGTAPQSAQAAAGGDLPQLDVYAPSQLPGMMTPRSEMTPGVPMPAQTPPDPAGAIREMAGTSSLDRIWQAMQHGYESSQTNMPGLTPEAHTALEQWPLGLGYPVKAVGGLGGAGMGVLSGLFQGGLATAYETGTNLFGLPPALMRDFTGYLETGGMSGAPHYTMPPRVGPGFEALRDQSTIGGMVQPERQGFLLQDPPAPLAPLMPGEVQYSKLTHQPPIEWNEPPHTGPGDAPVTLDRPLPVKPTPEPAPVPPTIWRSKDYDYPVEPTGNEMPHSDGRVYAEVKQPDGTVSWVPKDELVVPGQEPSPPSVGEAPRGVGPVVPGDNTPPSQPPVPELPTDRPSPEPSPVVPPPPEPPVVPPHEPLSPRPGELPTNVDQPPPVVSPPEPSVVPASTERPTPVAADATPPAVPRSELAEPQPGTQPERVADVKPSDTPLDVTGQRQDTEPVTGSSQGQDLRTLSPDDLYQELIRRGEAATQAEDAIARTKRGSPEEAEAVRVSEAADKAHAEVRDAYNALPDRNFIVTFRDYGRNKTKFTETERVYPGKSLEDVRREQERLNAEYVRHTGRRVEIADVRPADDARAQTDQSLSLPGGDVTDAARRRGPKDGGGPEPPVPGRRTEADYYESKGVSPYHANIYIDAGHDPVVATNYPVARQVNIMHRQVKEGLGFKAVEIGPGQRPEEVRDNLADLYHGSQELMSLLGRSHTTMGQNGQVTLRLEGSPKGNTLGSYNRKTKVLTLMGKYQTLGHEWAHAEDNIIVQRLTGDPKVYTVPTAAQQRRGATGMASILARTKGLDPSADVPHAIAHLMNTIFFDEADTALHRMDLEQRAQGTGPEAVRAQTELNKLEAGSTQLPILSTRFRALAQRLNNPDYWASPQELLARTREAHMARKAEQNGVDPRGVVMRDEAYASETIKAFNMIYPDQAERIAIFRAWDNYDAAMEREAAYGPRGARAVDPGADLLLDRPKTPVGHPKISEALRKSLDSMRNWQQNLSDIWPYDSKRPVNQRSLLQQTHDIARLAYRTKAGLVEVARDRAMPEARRFVQTIRDKMGLQAGTGRASGPNFIRRFQDMSHDLMNDYASVLSNTGVQPHRLKEAELKAIDRILTGVSEDSGTITLEQGRMVQGLRHVFNKAHDMLKEAGYDVGYLGNWRPRIVDRLRVDAEGPRFLDQAEKGYRRAFDESMDHGSPDHAENLLDAWDRLHPEAQVKAGHTLATQMEAIRKNLKEQAALERDIRNNPANAPTLLGELADLKAAAKELALDTHNRLGNFVAREGALDWQVRILTTPGYEVHKTTAGGNYLRQRTLPDYFDDYMQDFYDHNIAHWAPNYLHSVARATAKAEIWGRNWEKLNDLIDQAVRAGQDKNGRPGLMLGDDTLIRKQVERTVNPGHTPIDQRGVAGALNALMQYTSLLQLGRTPISLLSEFATGAMSYSDVRQAFHNFAGTMKQITRSGDAAAVADLANFIGVTQAHYHSEAVLDRHMVDYANNPRLGRIMSKNYELSGMTPLTDANRRGAMEGTHWRARMWADRLLHSENPNVREDAQRFFNEHGAGPEVGQERYAQWLLDHPTVADIQHNDPMLEVHRNVLLEGTERQVLTGDPAHTPTYAEHYLGRLPFQFLNYASQFQQKILKRLANEAEFQGHRAARQARDAGAGGFKAGATAVGAQAKVYGQFLGGFAAATLAQLPTTALRQLLYAPRQWDEHEKAGDLLPWLLETASQRTGVAGIIDPLQQVFTGLKYNADITSILDGSAINSVSRDVMHLIGPYIKDPAGTNTLQFDQAKAAYNLFMAPMVALGGIAAGTVMGPAGRLVAPAVIQTGTSRVAGDRAAEMFAGPRGTKDPVTHKPKSDKLPDLPPLPGDRKTEKKADAGGSNPLTGLALGLSDDAAIAMQPMVPRLMQIIGSLPGGTAARVAVGAALGGAAVGAKYVQNEKYRNQPPQKKAAQR